MSASLAQIERGLAAAFPELAVAPVRPLATGFGSVAVETRDGIIFRIARSHGSADGQAAEFRALPALRGRLPAEIPDPRWRIEPGGEPFPLGAIGYRKIRGEPLSPALAEIDPEHLATDLGAFFAALHAVPLDEVRHLDLDPWIETGAGLRRYRDTVLPTLRDRLTADEYAAVVRWWERLLADPSITTFRPVLRHGDPWYGNVIIDADSGRLVGVVDWEGVEIGDPAWDAAGQLYLGERFLRSFLDAYAAAGGIIEPELEQRARKLFELHEFGGVRRALEIRDDDELADAVAKLRRTSILAE